MKTKELHMNPDTLSDLVTYLEKRTGNDYRELMETTIRTGKSMLNLLGFKVFLNTDFRLNYGDIAVAAGEYEEVQEIHLIQLKTLKDHSALIPKI